MSTERIRAVGIIILRQLIITRRNASENKLMYMNNQKRYKCLLYNYLDIVLRMLVSDKKANDFGWESLPLQSRKHQPKCDDSPLRPSTIIIAPESRNEAGGPGHIEDQISMTQSQVIDRLLDSLLDWLIPNS
jgi:hypothetical protein